MLIIRFIALLGLYFFSGTSVLFAGTCTTLTGDPANEVETKIDSDCQNLIITGSNNNVIIGENNPSVVIQSSNGGTPDYDFKKAVITTNSQDTTIINYGNIGKNNTNLKSFAIWHDTGSGSIKLLDNRGNIKANDHTAINNRSSIDTINNSGMIYTHKKNGIANGAGGEIKKIINSGTIEAKLDWAIKNVSGGNIDEITNTTTGTIRAKRDKAIRNYGSNSIITTITNDGLITSTESTIENESPDGQTGALISNIINTGTIQQHTKSNGKTIKNKNATIDTVNNSGTIRAVGARADYAIYNVSYGKINNIINSGFIKVNDNVTIKNGRLASIGIINNSGTIHASDNAAVFNEGQLNQIINSGTISAGDDDGIKNTGTINYISNTGTISAGNNIGIFNDGGTITTLDNSQSNLTYKGALPTNYNAIISSPSDYGKIVFSGVSGATNFGVHSSSTLAVGTYSAVMSGLSANNIASGISGTFVSGADRINWALENIDSIWNLVIAEKIDITPDTEESIKTSVKSNTIDSFNDLNSVIEVNFANMNTYDCDSFGKRNGCISLGGRNTHINNPRTKTNGIVLTGGYKFSDSLRVAGFYHRNYGHNTPKRFKLSDKTPLLGTIIVWNQYSNGLGLQIKLATAFQQKYATLIREIVGSSEEGRAKTEIGTKSRVIEFQQGYRFNDDIILHPYLAFRKATSKQDAYSEVGILSPLSFNAIKDEMITALLGLKFDIKKFGNLPDELTFKGSLGIEHDLSHSVSKIEPTGISGLTAVSLTESFNSTRPVASLGFDYKIKPNQRFSGITQFQELPYENKDETNYYLYFTQGF